MSLEKYLTEFLESLGEKYLMPGCDCSVWHKGTEIYRKQLGYADVAKKKPITEKTLYNIYSSSKFITCAAALTLLERGKLRLDDKLSQYFPECENMTVKTPDGGVKPAENKIRIRDLFTMTAGFRYDGYEKTSERFMKYTNGECPLILLPKYVAEEPLEFEPSTGYLYSICHDVLGAVVEQISGMRFSEYLKKNIFEPLGMENTSFYIEDLDGEELAMQYRFSSKDRTLSERGQHNALVPPILKESGGGGLITTVDDYMKFQEGMRKGIILNRRTIDLMRTDFLTPEQKKGFGGTKNGYGYGLGVRVVTDLAKTGCNAGYTAFGWDGAAGSYSSVDPENELCIFYAQHLFGTDNTYISSTIRNIVYAYVGREA